MTPAKEKARDLVNSFYYALPNNGGFTGLNSTTSRYQEGIRCALIAVDEKINLFRQIILDFHLDENEKALNIYRELKEVKQEIQKLS